MGNDPTRKRAEQVARVLAETIFLIRALLTGLDDLTLALHPPGPGVRDRIADDYIMVALEVLPGVDAPDDLLTFTRSVLVDWTILSDLLDNATARGYTGRRLETMEEVARRLAATLLLIREIYPDRFEDREE